MSTEQFEQAGKQWLKATWDAKYLYSFTWMGQPILQLPDDLIRLQEIIYKMRPDRIIETGVAHGGSIVFFASLLYSLGRGLVLGIERGLLDTTKDAIATHALGDYMRLIEGDSVNQDVVDYVSSFLDSRKRVFVFLDSDHSYAHVRKELELYSPFVTPGSYIIACDGIIGDLVGHARVPADAATNNATAAADDFLATHPEFERVTFNSPTYFRGGWLRRKM